MKLYICINSICLHTRIPALLFLFLNICFIHSFTQQTRKINHDADNMEYDRNLAEGAYRLLGNVVFRHERATMYCDSAYFYSNDNSLDAFDNVYVNQADSMHLYGDFLHYDGNTRVANVRRNVSLISEETNLTTDALDFDLRSNVGYYTSGADIVSGQNKLNSREGYYYSKSTMYFFKDSVVIINPDYTIYTYLFFLNFRFRLDRCKY